MSAPARKTVELFYDVLSPYAWIGFEVMTRYSTKWSIDLQLRPMLLGGIMAATGNQPPAMVAAKGQYMHKDIDRAKEIFNIPINHMSNPGEVLFKKGSLRAMRFITAVDMKLPQCTEALSRALWMRIHSRDEDITETDSLKAAGTAAGLSDAEIADALERMATPEVKKRLKDYTDKAINYGAFGAPTMVAHINGKPEMVFGSDRISTVAWLLGEKYEGPLPELSKAKL